MKYSETELGREILDLVATHAGERLKPLVASALNSAYTTGRADQAKDNYEAISKRCEELAGATS